MLSSRQHVILILRLRCSTMPRGVRHLPQYHCTATTHMGLVVLELCTYYGLIRILCIGLSRYPLQCYLPESCCVIRELPGDDGDHCGCIACDCYNGIGCDCVTVTVTGHHPCTLFAAGRHASAEAQEKTLRCTVFHQFSLGVPRQPIQPSFSIALIMLGMRCGK